MQSSTQRIGNNQSVSYVDGEGEEEGMGEGEEEEKTSRGS